MDEIEPTPVGEFVQTLRADRSDDRNQHCLLKGEISQWKPYPSGHTYFSLRDDGGQINAVIWKGRCRIPDGIKDGQEVLIIGSVDLIQLEDSCKLSSNASSSSRRSVL